MIHNFFHYMLHHTWSMCLLGVLTGAAIVFSIVFRRTLIRTARRIFNRLLPFTTPSWKIIMSVARPGFGRPRFLSLHTLGILTGRSDPLKLAKEMKRSCEVNISFCGGVKSPVFCLHTISDYTDPSRWSQLAGFLKMFPYPEIKGFQAGEGHWSGGAYGIGKFTPHKNAMSDPFIKEDYAYANKIIKTLRSRGRTPGIQEYKIDKG